MTVTAPRRDATDAASARSACRSPALVLAVVAIAFFALPFIGLLWRAPWGDVLVDPHRRRASLTALRLSLVLLAVRRPRCRSCSACRWRGCWPASRSRAAAFVRALCTLSMVLPPVVGGVALFFALGRRGLVGQYLDRWFDIRLPFTTAGVIVAQTFVAMPFLVITVEAALRQLDTRFEDAARTLGASRWYVFRRVTLPAIRPGLVAGAVLAWARALGRVRRDDHLRRQLPRHARRRCRWPSTSRSRPTPTRPSC